MIKSTSLFLFHACFFHFRLPVSCVGSLDFKKKKSKRRKEKQRESFFSVPSHIFIFLWVLLVAWRLLVSLELRKETILIRFILLFCFFGYFSDRWVLLFFFFFFSCFFLWTIMMPCTFYNFFHPNGYQKVFFFPQCLLKIDDIFSIFFFSFLFFFSSNFFFCACCNDTFFFLLILSTFLVTSRSMICFLHFLFFLFLSFFFFFGGGGGAFKMVILPNINLILFLNFSNWKIILTYSFIFYFYSLEFSCKTVDQGDIFFSFMEDAKNIR